MGGYFIPTNGEPRSQIARLNEDGSLDMSFRPTVSAPAIQAFALQSDGKILAGGNAYLARLKDDGSPDPTFTTDLIGNAGGVLALAMQPGGKVLVGGNLAMVNGERHPGIARLHADGSLDRSFVAAPKGAVQAMALQPNSTVLLAGGFVEVSGQAHNNIARVKAP